MYDLLPNQRATSQFRFSLKQLMVAITILACVIGFSRAACIAVTHVEAAEDVDRVDWLPDSASNISYYRSYSYTAYEFDIPEDDFIEWSRWELEPITQPVQVSRYRRFAASNALPPTPTPAELTAWDDQRRRRVTMGLFFEQRRSNGGGVTVVYDRSQQRGYFQTNPR